MRDEALTVADELSRKAPFSGMTEEQLVALEQMQKVANGLGEVERAIADPAAFAAEAA
jgi:hypothetical protein